jgi:hypothetical protein
MEFLRVTANSHYFRRYESTGGYWEAGLIPEIFGTAVGFSRVDSDGTVESYGCGENQRLAINVLHAVVLILGQYPETLTEQEARKIFPKWMVRPISGDPCYQQLLTLAGLKG